MGRTEGLQKARPTISPLNPQAQAPEAHSGSIIAVFGAKIMKTCGFRQRTERVTSVNENPEKTFLVSNLEVRRTLAIAQRQ